MCQLGPAVDCLSSEKMRDNGGTKHMMLLAIGAVIGFIIHDVAVLSIMSLPVEGRYILSELCVRKVGSVT